MGRLARQTFAWVKYRIVPARFSTYDCPMQGKGFPNSKELAGTPVRSKMNPSRSILVVEDEESIRRINATALHYAGYYVDTAEDGACAWELLGSKSYDLMITDNNMPRLTGVELLKKLFAARITLPFIMASGELPEAEFDKHPWLRPTATLVKPYTVEELLGTVEKVLHQADDDATSSSELEGRESIAGKIAQTVPPANPPVPCLIPVAENELDLSNRSAKARKRFGY